jgi:cell division protein FtsQ
VAVVQGQPILAISLEEMHARLKEIPEVKNATIRRVLPDKLAIHLSERVPAALWQYDGQSALLDADGMILAAEKYRGAHNLPVVVGADAPKHIGEFMAFMKAAPQLKNDVVAAIRVGSRRWNVQLKRDIIVMLPEDAPADAWKRFAALVTEKALLTKAVRSIDMRMEDRVFIMPVEENKPPVTLTSARST